MLYIFKTTATMKPHNCKNWWIDRDIIREKRIEAENVREALELYRESVNDRDGVEISRNAIKNREPMYIDRADGEPEQIGFVITGKTDFDKGDYSGWSTQYIDLWVTVLTVVKTDFAA